MRTKRYRIGDTVSYPKRKAVGRMLTRMLGCDATVEFTPKLVDILKRAEAAFPAPEFAVMYADAQDEDDDDTLTIARRYAGFLIPMVYITLDEVDQLEEDGFDWLGAIKTDLSRTEAEIEAAEQAEMDAPGFDA